MRLTPKLALCGGSQLKITPRLLACHAHCSDPVNKESNDNNKNVNKQLTPKLVYINVNRSPMRVIKVHLSCAGCLWAALAEYVIETAG